MLDATRSAPQRYGLRFVLMLSLAAPTFLVIAPTSAQQQTSWSAPIDVGAALPVVRGGPQIAMSSDGSRQTITWVDTAVNPPAVRARLSSDAGATWGDAFNLDASPETLDDAVIAMSTDGVRQAIAWTRSSGTGDQYVLTRVSSDSGATWTSEVDLGLPGGYATNPRIAMSGDGTHITVSWDNADFSVSPTVRTVEGRSSGDGGATWRVGTTMSGAGIDAYGSRLAISTDGSKQTVTWYHQSTVASVTTRVPRARSSVDGGATWLPIVALADGATGLLQIPEVAMSSDGLHQTITWHAGNSGSAFIVYVRSSADSGLTWSDPAFALTPNDMISIQGKIALSVDGNVQALAYAQRPVAPTSNYTIQVRTSQDSGASWSPAVEVSDNQSQKFIPHLAMSGDGQQLAIAWPGITPGIMRVAQSYDGGATWQTPLDLSDEFVDVREASLVMSSDGSKLLSSWLAGPRSTALTPQLAVGTGLGSAVSTVQGSRAEFRFLLPDGRECGSISPLLLLRGSMFTLPDADAECRTNVQSSIIGWTIPTPPDSTEFGSSMNPFPTGLPVRVVDSQQFTAVIYEPTITIELDANVATADVCLPEENDDLRRSFVWVPRADFDQARLPLLAPCTPPGYTLRGWDTRTSYGVLTPGSGLPPAWSTAVQNNHRLFAQWSPIGTQVEDLPHGLGKGHAHSQTPSD